jgi:hypothetical protein
MKAIYITLSLALFFTACSTPQMAFNESTGSPKESYAVKGRQGLKIRQKLSFGSFQTTNIQRSWTRGSSSLYGVVGVLWASYEKRKQTFSFKLTDNQSRSSEVFCITEVRSEDLFVGRNPNSLFNILTNFSMGPSDNVFAADIYTGKAEGPWQLVIDNNKAQLESKTYVGYLAKDADNYYKVIPAREMKIRDKTGTMPFGSIGFEFRNRADQLVAAVSLINNGVVYFGQVNDEEKFLLANACSALLLQEVIE